MPSLIFLEKEVVEIGVPRFTIMAFFTQSGELLKGDTPAWSPNASDLMELTQNDLLNVAPSHLVKSYYNKSQLSSIILENWDVIIEEKTLALVRDDEKKQGGSYGGGRGSGGSGGGKGDEDDVFGGVPIPPMPDDDDAFDLTVQKTWAPTEFKVFKVNPLYTVEMLKAVVSYHFKVGINSIRLMEGGIDLLDHLELVVLDIDNTKVVNAVIRGLGGASQKRPREMEYLPQQEQLNIKEVKQEVNEGLARLRGNEAFRPIVEKCQFIYDSSKDHPTQVSANLLSSLSEATKAKLQSNTITVSTRIADRVRFVAENSLEDEFAIIGQLKSQWKVADKLLCDTIRFAIMSQWSDNIGNTIQWQSFTDCLLQMIRNRVEPPARRNCIIQ